MLDPMSEEQRIFFNVILKGENAIGDACAGSGKSTTILSIASLLPNLNFVQLTYNNMLCNEVKQKVQQLNLTNINVYTYHSLVVKYYNHKGYTDSVIRTVLLENTAPKTTIPPFQVFVLDEAQDMTFLYFKMMVKFCRDMKQKIQLLILGDYMQGLYEFKGADTRFLTHAHEIWKNYENLCSPVFNFCTLKMSYRITEPMAQFVNNVMLGETRLLSCKNGEPVVYIRRPTCQVEKIITYTIITLLKEGARPDDFFILSASIKCNNDHIYKIENSLVENNIPCYVPIMDDDKVDERVIKGKIVFSTFHSVKGRQRKFVFVIGFNNSYLNFTKNTHDKCPNTLYVATTRATNKLFVVELNNYPNDRPLEFLKLNHVEMENQSYIKFNGIKQLLYSSSSINESSSSSSKNKIKDISPTELIKFIPDSTLEIINPILNKIFIKISSPENEYDINISSVTQSKQNLFEDVSNLNGIAIPMMYFDHICNKNRDLLIRLINEKIEYTNPNSKNYKFLKKYTDNLPGHCSCIEDYLFLSNLYSAFTDKYFFKLKQIDKTEYNWLSQKTINSCFKRLNNTLKQEYTNNTLKIEKNIIRKDDTKSHEIIDKFLSLYFNDLTFRFTAIVDLITDYSVWEIKCTNNISQEHLLQITIYAWIWRMVVENIQNLENVRDFKIFNIKTGEIFKLESTTEELNQIVIALLKGKFQENIIKTENDFLKDCKSVFI
jgi:hypothetical protein